MPFRLVTESFSISAMPARSLATCAAMPRKVAGRLRRPRPGCSQHRRRGAAARGLAASPVEPIARTVASVSGRSRLSQNAGGRAPFAAGCSRLAAALGRILRGQRHQDADQSNAVGDAVVDADNQRLAAVVVVDQMDLPQRLVRDRAPWTPVVPTRRFRSAVVPLPGSAVRATCRLEVEVVVEFPVVTERHPARHSCGSARAAGIVPRTAAAGARNRRGHRTRRRRRSASDWPANPSAATPCRRTTSARACPCCLPYAPVRLAGCRSPSRVAGYDTTRYPARPARVTASEPANIRRRQHHKTGDTVSDLKAKFEKAVADSKNLPERPDNQTLLKLYALFKQASDRRRRRQAAGIHRHGRARQVGCVERDQGHEGRRRDEAVRCTDRGSRRAEHPGWRGDQRGASLRRPRIETAPPGA